MLSGGPGNLDAHIEESWIYGVVLDQDEIKNLIEATGTGGANGTTENAVYDQDQSGTSASNNPPGPLTTSKVIGCYKYGEIPSLLDYINRNLHDNRYENLRPASRSWNSFNRNAAVNGTGKSPYRGVVGMEAITAGGHSSERKEKNGISGCFPALIKGKSRPPLLGVEPLLKNMAQMRYQI